MCVTEHPPGRLPRKSGKTAGPGAGGPGLVLSPSSRVASGWPFIPPSLCSLLSGNSYPLSHLPIHPFRSLYSFMEHIHLLTLWVIMAFIHSRNLYRAPAMFQVHGGWQRRDSHRVFKDEEKECRQEYCALKMLP